MLSVGSVHRGRGEHGSPVGVACRSGLGCRDGWTVAAGLITGRSRGCCTCCPALACDVLTRSWHLLGALLLLALGLADLAVSLSGDGSGVWRVSALLGLGVTGMGLRWLHDLQTRARASKSLGQVAGSACAGWWGAAPPARRGRRR